MKKTLMALAAVATLAVSTASPALARHYHGRGWGPGLAAGLLGGAIIGGAIAASPYYYGPGYYYGPAYYPGYYAPAPYGGPVGPCYWRRERFWNGYAWHVRRVRFCG
ncbi:MAG: hypothetical protein ACREDL_06845 [Bradyrhizobium sp.]